jgi:ribonuclease HII
MSATLPACFALEDHRFEIGVDEAGRGPMFGRVYTAAVILPKPNTQQGSDFQFSLLKDSKKFHSEKKIQAAAAYIKDYALAWSITFASEKVIDEINIRNATHQAMHEAITNVTTKYPGKDYHLLIDGNDFTDYDGLTHTCIEGGDNKYCAIAAASILAKVGRDDYIRDLCAMEPDLITKYDLLKNKGYGTQKHMQGIETHGITPYHRKSFGLCKKFRSFGHI